MDTSKTIKEAKQYLRHNYEKGTDCPCCGQFVKLYKRKLGSTQARALILLSKQESEWTHIREIIKVINVHGDFAKMSLWGLIEEKPNEDNGKKNSGIWKITQKGRDFVNLKTTIPSHVHIYNAKVMGFSETHADIVECLGKNFNYRELMNA